MLINMLTSSFIYFSPERNKITATKITNGNSAVYHPTGKDMTIICTACYLRQNNSTVI